MPYTPLTDTRSEVSDFRSRHPGNFRFSTFIENDALTFSFEPSFTITNPSTPDYSTYSPITPSYSPIQRESPAEQDPIVASGPPTVTILDVIQETDEDNAVLDDNDAEEQENVSGSTLGEKSPLSNLFSDLFNDILIQGGHIHPSESPETTTNAPTRELESHEEVQSSSMLDSSLPSTTTDINHSSSHPLPLHTSVNLDNVPANVLFTRPILDEITPPPYMIPVTPHNTVASDDDIPGLITPSMPLSTNKSIPPSLAPPAALLEGITPHDAHKYLDMEIAQLSDFHSVYFKQVTDAVASFNFCQDQLIANDWDIELYHDDSYPGHLVFPNDPKLPTGGPCSGRDWSDRLKELYDHRAHSRHLLRIADTILSPHMFKEATCQSTILKCDQTDHIKGGTPKSFYASPYVDVNPFFSPTKPERLNSFISVACFHNEDAFASALIDTLLMPYPDEDTIHVLVTSDLLDSGSRDKTLQFACDRDHILGVKRSGLVILATSPFLSTFPPESSLPPSTFYVLGGLDEEQG
ncbi:hypothetical protein F4604DRAFT_1925824 [Suillus subluteus]|nr:hypothetical protein F4604DRAFT_1925824 [Suillus subluteus]